MTREEAVKMLQATRLMLMDGANQPVSDLYYALDMAIEALEQTEPKRGEWIVYEGGWKDLDYYPPKCKCNQCGYEEELYILNAKPTNFCSNCGAKMKGANNE